MHKLVCVTTLLLTAMSAGMLTGCSSVMNEGTTAVAGMGGAAIAGAVTENAAIATGIGLGVQAGAKAALQASQRKVHAETQHQIAQVAGNLDVGAVATWEVAHAVPLEPDEKGRVTVTRLLGNAYLACKEIIFSVDDANKGNGFYIAAVCRDGSVWKWASAEPATERWGSLQ